MQTNPPLDLYGRRPAHFYDAFHATYAGDLPYYLKLAKKHPGPLLELACGTGRVGIELIKAGADYFGMDASEGMLDLFRVKWKKLRRLEEARILAGDMRHFELRRKFNLTLITHNSLQHIYLDQDVLQVFALCRRHMEPGSRLVFDIFNPDWRFLDRDPFKRYPVSKFFDEERSEWCEVAESNRYDRESKVNSIQWHYDYEKGESGTFQLEMRQFFPQEIDALVDTAGFKILNKWGDFVGSGFSSASPRQVFECEIFL